MPAAIGGWHMFIFRGYLSVHLYAQIGRHAAEFGRVGDFQCLVFILATYDFVASLGHIGANFHFLAAGGDRCEGAFVGYCEVVPVSYTHLTLPTTSRV